MKQDARLAAARERMGALFTPNQLLGRHLTIGCTAVEITQRCNLDCTLCYLSEHSQQVADLPLEEVLRRLDDVRAHYGPRTSVQITGGDPCLRKHDELVEIVAHARRIGLFPALFTNGIAASRKLLERLAAVGLCDVAFHVDTTQQRVGFDSEEALHAVRREYIDRARGLDLMVIFNTTIHRDNVAELPALVRFFMQHADSVGLASFQLQADTGRGAWGARDEGVSMAGVRRTIDTVAARELPWDAVRIGHPDCHSYLPCLVAGGRLLPLIEEQPLFERFVNEFDGTHADRRLGRLRAGLHYTGALIKRPRWLLLAGGYVLRSLWRSRYALLAARGRVHKLSFFVQNFMDRDGLDEARVDACSFMVMTAQGPVSMCEHNARRDEYILKPLRFRRRDGSLADYHPLPGPVHAATRGRVTRRGHSEGAA